MKRRDTPLARLEMMPIKGNAHDDRHLFDAAHCIIANPASPFEHKIAALRKMDEAMGESGEYTQTAIDEYLAFTSEETKVTVTVTKLTYAPGGKWDCGVLKFTADTELGTFTWDEVVPGPRHSEDSGSLVAKLDGVEITCDELDDLDFEPPNKEGRWADKFAETAEEIVTEQLSAWLESCRDVLVSS